MKKNNNHGFTLIEAAVAIAVVAILAGIIVPLVVKSIQDSQLARAKNDIQVIAAALASQLKDTGTRPSKAGTKGTGVGSVSWQSPGAPITNLALTGGDNTFTNLFCGNATDGNSLFGTTTGAEFAYKGPYLANDVAAKSDPWGGPYFILGYSATNLTANGPIWVASAGPNHVHGSAAVTLAAAEAYVTWPMDANSADDLYVRVN